MNIRLVSDSTANLIEMSNTPFESVPMKIIIGEREFVDDANVSVAEMMQVMKGHKGKTSTACPGVQEWLDAFGDADVIYGTTITSGLSGSYNSAAIAANQYMEKHPGRKVFILDSLSAGPELELVMEKFRELALEKLPFEDVCEKIKAYLARTKLIFSLESLENFARNGRVSHAVAAIVGVLGIRVVGRASDEGTLEPLHKARGEKAAIQKIIKHILESGYNGGKARISHTENHTMAEAVRAAIIKHFPDADVRIRENRALCSYYAETGGVLMGYETSAQ